MCTWTVGSPAAPGAFGTSLRPGDVGALVVSTGPPGSSSDIGPGRAERRSPVTSGSSCSQRTAPGTVDSAPGAPTGRSPASGRISPTPVSWAGGSSAALATRAARPSGSVRGADGPADRGAGATAGGGVGGPGVFGRWAASGPGS